MTAIVLALVRVAYAIACVGLLIAGLKAFSGLASYTLEAFADLI